MTLTMCELVTWNGSSVAPTQPPGAGDGDAAQPAAVMSRSGAVAVVLKNVVLRTRTANEYLPARVAFDAVTFVFLDVRPAYSRTVAAAARPADATAPESTTVPRLPALAFSVRPTGSCTNARVSTV